MVQCSCAGAPAATRGWRKETGPLIPLLAPSARCRRGEYETISLRHAQENPKIKKIIKKGPTLHLQASYSRRHDPSSSCHCNEYLPLFKSSDPLARRYSSASLPLPSPFDLNIFPNNKMNVRFHLLQCRKGAALSSTAPIQETAQRLSLHTRRLQPARENHTTTTTATTWHQRRTNGGNARELLRPPPLSPPPIRQACIASSAT